MREIKFRAWDKKKGKMIYQFNMTSDGKAYGWAKATICDGVVIDEPAPLSVELMQYTGLKDKNGREIYEGDIVKTSCGDIGIIKFGIPKDMTINGGEYDVDYIGFYIDIIKGDWGTTDVESRVAPLVDDYYEIEVIGNIYENPELLEEVTSNDE